MRLMGLIIILIGIIYLIYSILFRNKVTVYHRNNKMIVLNKKGYFKLQLYFSMISSLYFVITGLVIIITHVNMSYIILSVLIFHLINYFLKIKSKKLGYISCK
jgi:hypothetical protein